MQQLKDEVLAYAKKIDIDLQDEDVEQILRWAREDGVTDVRFSVWDFLDAYEGISHNADPEFFKDEEGYE